MMIRYILIGLEGSNGSGKSFLIDRLKHILKDTKNVKVRWFKELCDCMYYRWIMRWNIWCFGFEDTLSFKLLNYIKWCWMTLFNWLKRTICQKHDWWFCIIIIDRTFLSTLVYQFISIHKDNNFIAKHYLYNFLKYQWYIIHRQIFIIKEERVTWLKWLKLRRWPFFTSDYQLFYRNIWQNFNTLLHQYDIIIKHKTSSEIYKYIIKLYNSSINNF